MLIFGLLLGVVFYFLTSGQGETKVLADEVQYLSNEIELQGAEKAYAAFATKIRELEYNKQHEQAHYFGEALYRTIGTKGVTVCDAQFGFGCFHSFFGYALQEEGLGILDELDQNCIDHYGEKGLGCQHGIGHGVLTELGYDELDSALEACSGLVWQGAVGGCTSGVFMEYNFATMLDGQMRTTLMEDPYAPCTEVEDRFKASCYFEQPAWWIAYTQYDYSFAGEHCEMISDTAYREYCYRGIGNVVAGSENYVIENTKAACSQMPNSDGQLLCIEGAAWITSAQPEFEAVWHLLCEAYTGEAFERCMASRDFI